ncbi:hypothetical protein Btru_068249 [Bulinus truncatus]|nr:hypothetical protein Btru_068249 [Bulinus truncatus]
MIVNLLDFSKRRESQLNQLEQIFLLLNDQYYEKSVDKHAITLEDVNHLNKISQSTLENHQLEDILKICNSVLLDPKYRHVNFLQVHNCGCTLDDTELPHHISTAEQVHALMTSFKNFLEFIPRPTIVTIARSSTDGYCPVESVDYYQREILKILENHFGSLQVSAEYDD